MGTLKGFAPPFGPPPATASPLASLGLAMPSHDGAPPATRAREAQGGRGGLSVPKSPQGEPAGSPRDYPRADWSARWKAGRARSMVSSGTVMDNRT